MLRCGFWSLTVLGFLDRAKQKILRSEKSTFSSLSIPEATVSVPAVDAGHVSDKSGNALQQISALHVQEAGTGVDCLTVVDFTHVVLEYILQLIYVGLVVQFYLNFYDFGPKFLRSMKLTSDYQTCLHSFFYQSFPIFILLGNLYLVSYPD